MRCSMSCLFLRNENSVVFLLKEKGPTLLVRLYSFVQRACPVLKQERALAEQGYRVIVLAHSPQICENHELPATIEPLGFFLLSDTVRSDAKATLEISDPKPFSARSFLAMIRSRLVKSPKSQSSRSV